LKFHPDKCTGDKKAAEEKFKGIANAHDTLGNKERREEYDLSRNFTGAGVRFW
jgi:curved DNA-binding protein CbpA